MECADRPKLEAHNMKKIPCLFVRDFSTKPFTITQAVTPGCECVLDGLAYPTVKRDGSACFFKDGKLWKRYDVKKGRAVPVGAIPCEPAPDATTGHWPHWVEVGTGPEDKWHVEAFSGLRASDGSRFRPKAELEDGQTYELVGPRIQGNPDRLAEHELTSHGVELLLGVPLTFDGLRDFLDKGPIVDPGTGRREPIEGIVWWGRVGLGVKDGSVWNTTGISWVEAMKTARPIAKLRRDDFGFDWPRKG